jgi:hypothetical protein
MDMRDSEILQAKMAARLLSGLKEEQGPRSPLKHPEPVEKSDNMTLKAQEI